MNDIDGAIARGFRYPGRFDDEYRDHDEDEEVYPDDAPYDIPGARSPLPLPPAQSAALAQAVDAGLHEHGCDNTLRAAQAWARREEVRWPWLREALADRGGFCDCEVLLNVLVPPD